MRHSVYTWIAHFSSRCTVQNTLVEFVVLTQRVRQIRLECPLQRLCFDSSTFLGYKFLFSVKNCERWGGLHKVDGTVRGRSVILADPEVDLSTPPCLVTLASLCSLVAAISSISTLSGIGPIIIKRSSLIFSLSIPQR